MGGKQDIFGQLWKEYSLSDSRYMTSDAFTVCMECITAVCWGPLCYYIAFCIATSHPLRHPLQVIVSLGQIYGDVLYYATSMFDHFYHGVMQFRPEPFYFYGYFVLMNAFWIVIPGCTLSSYPSFDHALTFGSPSLAERVQDSRGFRGPGHYEQNYSETWTSN